MARTIESIEDSTPMIDAALIYASYGIPVFPVAGVVFYQDDDGKQQPVCACDWGDACPAMPKLKMGRKKGKKGDERSCGKHPAIHEKGGVYYATTCVDVIKGWWKKWPTANIGIRTGRESRLLVIDVDNYKDGAPSLGVVIHDLLRLEHGEHIPLAQTGGGGSHLFFRHPMRMPISGKFKDHFKDFVDLQADGRYVLAAPSMHRSGQRYKWLQPISEDLPLFVPKKFVAAYDEAVTPASNGTVSATVSAMTDPATHQQIEACLGEAIRRCTKKLEADASNRLMLLGHCVNRHNLSDSDGLKAYVRWGQTLHWPKDWSEDEVLHRFHDAAKDSPDERGASVGEGAQESDCNYKWGNEYIEREVSWMWKHRLPHDKVAILAGLPGVGKSYLACLVAAHVATGAPFPGCDEDSRVKPLKVIILNNEDGIEDTQLKRLRIHGASVGDIAFLDSVQPRDGSGDRMFNMQRDTAALKATMADIKEKTGTRVGLIIWDPVDSYFGPGIDINSRIDVGAVLSHLVEMSKTEHVVNLCIAHLNKTQGISAVHRLSGSSAFASVARAIHYFTAHPTEPTKRLLVASKMTNSMLSEGLEFEFVDDRLQLSGVTDLSAEEMLGDQAATEETYKKKKGSSPAVTLAMRQIKEYINAAPGGKILGDVLKIAMCGKDGEEGKMSESMFIRARAKMGLTNFKVTDDDGETRWWTEFATEGEKF